MEAGARGSPFPEEGRAGLKPGPVILSGAQVARLVAGSLQALGPAAPMARTWNQARELMAIAARKQERWDSLLARPGFEQEHGDFLHATETGSRKTPSGSTKTGLSSTNPPNPSSKIRPPIREPPNSCWKTKISSRKTPSGSTKTAIS